MTDNRLVSEKRVAAIQWGLAIVVFESGLLQAGLAQARLGPESAAGAPALAIAGGAQAILAVLLVAPTATGFLPALAPLAAAALAVAYGAAASGLPVPVALDAPALAAAVAIATAGVAAARGGLLPIAAVELGPERADPWRRPAEQLERIRRREAAAIRERSAA
jgi:hypothetical protein